MSQRRRIEQLLVDRGGRGIHSFELFELGMPRGAVVIDRLRKRGWVIEARQELYHGGSQGVRYILRSRPSVQPRVTSPVASEQPEALFETSPARGGHYEEPS